MRRARNAVGLVLAAFVATTGILAGNAVLSPPGVRAETAPSPQNVNPQNTAGATPVQPLIPSLAPLVNKLKPAIVSVYVTAEQRGLPEDLQRQWQEPQEQPGFPFGFFFGPGSPEMAPRLVRAQGSGFFISPGGYILTNNHVVENARSVEIQTTKGKRYPAKVVGTDPKTDLALLKAEGHEPFPAVSFSDEPPQAGDWVIALGNPFGLGGTVTAGIVSALGRDIGSGPYDDYIQIDAPINKGNSGGPTFNLKGEVIGVNTAIISPTGGSVGIAFAIPAATAKFVAGELQKKGTVTRGWIGVSVQPVTAEIAESLGLKEAAGALISEIQRNGPAAGAGFKAGDVILSVNGQTVKDARDLALKIAALPSGQHAKFSYLRGGSTYTAEVKVAPYPSRHSAKAPAEGAPEGAETGLGLALAPAENVAGLGVRGAVAVAVDPTGKAAEQGIRAGDVIVAVDGKQVSGPEDVIAALQAAREAGKPRVLMRLRTAQGSRFVALPPA